MKTQTKDLIWIVACTTAVLLSSLLLPAHADIPIPPTGTNGPSTNVTTQVPAHLVTLTTSRGSALTNKFYFYPLEDFIAVDRHFQEGIMVMPYEAPTPQPVTSTNES